MKKIFIILFLFTSLLGVSSCWLTEEVDIKITVKNETGFEAVKLYISPSSDESFGEDLLVSFLPNGQSVKITLPKPYPSNKEYDFLLRTNEPAPNNEFLRQNIVVKNGATITITNNESGLTVYLLNNTEVVINELYVKHHNASNYSNNIINNPIQIDEYYSYSPPRPFAPNMKYDIKAVRNGNTFLRENVTFIDGITIELIESDPQITIYIVNNTGFAANKLYISRLQDWGIIEFVNLLTTNLAYGQTFTYVIPKPYDGTMQYDIQLYTVNDYLFYFYDQYVEDGDVFEMKFGDLSVTFTNQSPYIITDLFVVSPEAQSWGNSLISSNLNIGSSVTIDITPPYPKGQIFNILCYTIDPNDFSDGPNISLTDIYLSHEKEVIIDYDVFYTIRNNTGYTITEVYVKRKAWGDWGNNILSGEMPNTYQLADLRLLAPYDPEMKYDIKLVDTDSDTYTKMGVEIYNGLIINFTFDDYDH